MEHSPLERKLPVKKHHQKLVEGGEDSGFEVNLFLRHSPPVCSSVVASVFGIIAAVWWFLCVSVFSFIPSLQQCSSVSGQHRPRTCFTSPRLFLQTMATITATTDPGTELCPGWCLPQTMALNLLEIPTLLFQRMW